MLGLDIPQTHQIRVEIGLHSCAEDVWGYSKESLSSWTMS